MATMLEGFLRKKTTTAANKASATTTSTTVSETPSKKEPTLKERLAHNSYVHAVLDYLYSAKGGFKIHNAETGDVISFPEAVAQEIKWVTVEDGGDFTLLKLKNGKKQLLAFDGKELKVSPNLFDKAKIADDGNLYFEIGGQRYKKELKAPKPVNTPVEFTGNLF